MKREHWFIVLVVLVIFVAGVALGLRCSESETKSTLASIAEVHKNSMENQRLGYETLLVSQKVRFLEEILEISKKHREHMELALLVSRERRMVVEALLPVFRKAKYQPNLRIWWNRGQLQPWTAILLYNADSMPAGRFTDRNGFVLLHHAKRGERAVYIGEEGGLATVLVLTGDFEGKILTFKPWQRFDRQGALVYHF